MVDGQIENLSEYLADIVFCQAFVARIVYDAGNSLVRLCVPVVRTTSE